jgi:hypothetical protein
MANDGQISTDLRHDFSRFRPVRFGINFRGLRVPVPEDDLRRVQTGRGPDTRSLRVFRPRFDN